MLQSRKQNINSVTRSETGQSLVEFALVLPLLFTVMMLALECGWVLYQENCLEQMADAIVQSVDETPTEEQIKDYIRQYYSEYDLSDLQINLQVITRDMDYDEHIYRSDEGSHWNVPMYYKKLTVKIDIAYNLRYITPLGKYIFATSGNEKVLHATGISVRIVENDSR